MHSTGSRGGWFTAAASRSYIPRCTQDRKIHIEVRPELGVGTASVDGRHAYSFVATAGSGREWRMTSVAGQLLYELHASAFSSHIMQKTSYGSSLAEYHRTRLLRARRRGVVRSCLEWTLYTDGTKTICIRLSDHGRMVYLIVNGTVHLPPLATAHEVVIATKQGKVQHYYVDWHGSKNSSISKTLLVAVLFTTVMSTPLRGVLTPLFCKLKHNSEQWRTSRRCCFEAQVAAICTCMKRVLEKNTTGR